MASEIIIASFLYGSELDPKTGRWEGEKTIKLRLWVGKQKKARDLELTLHDALLHLQELAGCIRRKVADNEAPSAQEPSRG